MRRGAGSSIIAEAKKGNSELDPIPSEELEKIVNGFFKANTATSHDCGIA
jgi:hypothetical protein